MYCKICGKKTDDNVDFCQECEEKRKKYQNIDISKELEKSTPNISESNQNVEIFVDKNETQSQSVNPKNENEKELSNNNDNNSLSNDSNSWHDKSFGSLIGKTWLGSILITIIINGLNYLFFINTNFRSIWLHLGLFLLIIIINCFIVLIYIIISINKIINECFKEFKKTDIYLYIIITLVLFMLIVSNLFLLPYMYLLSATIILNIYNKMEKNNTIEDNKTKKKTILVLYLILITILVIKSIVPQFTYRKQFDTETNYCKEFIAATDEFVYCKTYNRIKRINLKDKSVNYYGQYVTYHRNLNYEDYIFYTNEINYTKMDLYVLDIKNGKSKRVKQFNGPVSITFNIQGNNAYFSVFTSAQNSVPEKKYVYNIKNEKLETLSDNIDDILFATNNKVYYCKNDLMSIYDIKTKRDNITNNKCEEDIFTDFVGDNNVYYNQYRFITRGTSLYIFDALDSNNSTIIKDEDIYYYYVYYYNNKVYVFSSSDSLITTNISYYDFATRSLVDTGISYNGTTNNSVDESRRYYSIIMKNNIMYYLEDQHLYTYNLETKENNEIVEDVSLLGGINGNYIYYFDKDDNFIRYNMITKNKDIIEKKG